MEMYRDRSTFSSIETGVKKFKFDIRKLDGESLHKLNHKFGLVLSLGSLEHSYDLNKFKIFIKF